MSKISSGLELVEPRSNRQAGRESVRIAVLALPNTVLSDLAGPYETFQRASQMARSNPRLAGYELDLLTIDREGVKTLSGLMVGPGQPFNQYKGFPHTLIVTGEPDSLDGVSYGTQLADWIRNGEPQIRRICAVCTGVFCLAAAGVLDGRHATTHWRYADLLASRFPRVKVNPEPVFLRDGKYYTSAGRTAGMDLALALIEEDLGNAIAAEIAREMVMFLRRPGGQAQISPVLKLQMSDHDPFRQLQSWIFEHLHLPLTVEDLALQVHMSPRNFARAFVAQVGVTPARFIESLRLDAARRRLEETDRGIEQIAAECGFGSAETMRRSFLRNLRTSPNSYRAQIQSA